MHALRPPPGTSRTVQGNASLDGSRSCWCDCCCYDGGDRNGSDAAAASAAGDTDADADADAAGNGDNCSDGTTGARRMASMGLALQMGSISDSWDQSWACYPFASPAPRTPLGRPASSVLYVYPSSTSSFRGPEVC